MHDPETVLNVAKHFFLISRKQKIPLHRVGTGFNKKRSQEGKTSVTKKELKINLSLQKQQNNTTSLDWTQSSIC